VGIRSVGYSGFLFAKKGSNRSSRGSLAGTGQRHRLFISLMFECLHRLRLKEPLRVASYAVPRGKGFRPSVKNVLGSGSRSAEKLRGFSFRFSDFRARASHKAWDDE